MYKPNKDELIPGTFDPIFKSLMINNKKYLADIISGITVMQKVFDKHPKIFKKGVTHTSRIAREAKR